MKQCIDVFSNNMKFKLILYAYVAILFFLIQGLYYKTYYGCNLCILVKSQSVCSWQAFPAQSILAGKAGAYPSEAPFKCSTLGQFPGLTHKHQTRLEKLTRDKHSSLLRKYINYSRNKSTTLHFLYNLQMDPIMRLERVARDKYPGLLSPIISYEDNEML